jgi:hypothetical protein
VASLAQFLLDPFYRTFPGFRVLVEKDWCGFGHQFAHRCHGGGCGPHGGSSGKESGGGGKEGSGDAGPVFVQWLDSVWQVLRQFPTAAEFSADLLLLLADASYGRWWGNFRESSDAERAAGEAAQADADAAADAVFGAGDAASRGGRCRSPRAPSSVWAHVSCCQGAYTNVLYRAPPVGAARGDAATAPGAAEFGGGGGQVLWPNPAVGALALWHALHVGGGGGPLQPQPSRAALLAAAAQKRERRARALLALLTRNGLGAQAAEVLQGLEEGSDDEEDEGGWA